MNLESLQVLERFSPRRGQSQVFKEASRRGRGDTRPGAASGRPLVSLCRHFVRPRVLRMIQPGGSRIKFWRRMGQIRKGRGRQPSAQWRHIGVSSSWTPEIGAKWRGGVASFGPVDFDRAAPGCRSGISAPRAAELGGLCHKMSAVILMLIHRCSACAHQLFRSTRITF
jgi:hypothetical protein